MTEDGDITVGELRDALRPYDDDHTLFFGTGGEDSLEFYRVKNRGGSGQPLVQIEFSTLYTIDPDC